MRTGAARSIRIDAEVSLPEVARDVGVAHSTIYRWEHNMNVPRGVLALRYLEILDDLAGVET